MRTGRLQCPGRAAGNNSSTGLCNVNINTASMFINSNCSNYKWPCMGGKHNVAADTARDDTCVWLSIKTCHNKQLSIDSRNSIADQMSVDNSCKGGSRSATHK